LDGPWTRAFGGQAVLFIISGTIINGFNARFVNRVFINVFVNRVFINVFINTGPKIRKTAILCIFWRCFRSNVTLVPKSYLFRKPGAPGGFRVDW
jgi:hypothetical protein